MDCKEFFKYNTTKVLTMFVLFAVTMVLGYLVGQIPASWSLVLAVIIFFPLGLYLFFHIILTVNLGDTYVCAFPGCDFLTVLLTLMTSAFLYYVISSAIYQMTHKENFKTKKNK